MTSRCAPEPDGRGDHPPHGTGPSEAVREGSGPIRAGRALGRWIDRGAIVFAIGVVAAMAGG